jgi:CoA:oxalate CoA-transferase
MNRLLKDCIIRGAGNGAAPGYSAILASLYYQADVLGIELATGLSAAEVDVSFVFEAPGAKPILCEIGGWPDSNVPLPVSENSMQAACGLMSVHGRAIGKAQSLGIPYISTLTAALGLQGAIAAAVGQLRGLDLRHSRVSMAAAALLSIGQYLAGATAEELSEKLLPGKLEHPDCPPFASRDGIVFELETLDPGPWQRFWAAVGIDTQLAGKGWSAFLLRYAKAVAPLPEPLVSMLGNLPYAEIETLARSTGVSLCPVRPLTERAKDPDCERVWREGPWSFEMADGNGAPISRASGKLPLSGLTVIESCRRIQGPLAGQMLALLGADVIRIEPPGGDPLRGMPPMADGCSARFDALNRGKQIREIDIKSTAGRQEVIELARGADVFLHNWAPGKAVELELDAADLRAVNPALIYAYAGGWSDRTGTRHLLGTDFMTQAYSGVAAAIASASERRGGSLFTVLDVLGGVVAAQGITTALLNRCLTGRSTVVNSSLMSAATLLMAGELKTIYQSGRAETSVKQIDDVFETEQGSLILHCPDDAVIGQLAAMLGIAGNTGSDDLMAELRRILRTKPAADWVQMLCQTGIPAAVVTEDLAELEINPLLASCLRQGSYTQVQSPWSFK